MIRVSVFVSLVALALLFAGSAFGQASNNGSDISTQLEAVFPTPIKRGVSGTLTVRVKNTLQPRPPIQLQATATYTDSSGVQRMVTSNVVTIQVVQPVTVQQISLQLPAGWVVGGGITFPIQLDVTLLEQQEHSVQIPVTIN